MGVNVATTKARVVTIQRRGRKMGLKISKVWGEELYVVLQKDGTYEGDRPSTLEELEARLRFPWELEEPEEATE